MSDRRPVGVFDSGSGGLSVAREIRSLLPAESLLYIADTRYAPYGNKPLDFIEERVLLIARFLVEHDAKAIVVACNTASAAAIDSIRKLYSLPIIGMEPAIKPAALNSNTGVVGILATESTLASDRYARLYQKFASECEIISQACPGLVEEIEKVDKSEPVLYKLLHQYIEPLISRGADIIVLGCTHYPLIREAIQNVAGSDVVIIDASRPVARQLQVRLSDNKLLADGQSGCSQFWSSGDEQQLASMVQQVLREKAEVKSFNE